MVRGQALTLVRGDVVRVNLDPTIGHEQQGLRPCVVVSALVAAAHQRFPMLVIVPITGTSHPGPLYPALDATPQSRLTKPSYALVDHVRAVDKRRAVKLLGRISTGELRAIDQGLQLLFGLSYY